MSTFTKKNYLDKLKLLILANAKNYPVKVYLFGSHAKNTTHRYSDIDIAILPTAPLSPHFISELKEKIEESTIPYHVDVVDLSQTDKNFRDKVLKEGIIWKD